jgi:hypothetical protein
MPYAPGQQYDFRPLFEGIRSLGQNVNQALDRRREDSQKFNSLRKLAEAYQPDLKGTLDGMSLGELEGTVKAFTLKQAMDEANASRGLRERGVAAQEKQVLLAEAMQQAGLAQRQREDQAATGFQGRLAELVQGGPLADGFREPGKVSLADIVSAAGSSGFKLPPGQLMEAVRSMQVDPEAQAPREFQIGGRAGVYSPRTGAFDLLPPEGLTAGQKQTAAMNLQKQWIEITQAMADPLKRESLPELRQARAMLEGQFEQFGLKPPASAPAPASDPSSGAKPSAGGRMRFDASGKPIKQ